MGKREEALACASQALEIDPHLEDAWLLKGQMLVELERPEEALPCLDRALALDPKLRLAWFSKGSALHALFRPREALACFEEAQRLGDTAAGEAADQCRKRMRDFGPDLGARDLQMAIESFRQAAAHGNARQWKEAVSCLDRTIKIAPRFPNAWLGKGIAVGSMGRHREALACFEEAQRLGAVEAAGLIAKAQRHLAEPEPASSPTNVPTPAQWLRQAQDAGRAGEWDAALDCCERAVALDPRDAEGWNQKGMTLVVGFKKIEPALACYDRALELNPDHEMSWNNKGMALSFLGRPAEATGCYDRVITLNPRNAQAWFLKGVALSESRNVSEAVRCLEEAQRLGHPKAAATMRDIAQAPEAATRPPGGTPPPVLPYKPPIVSAKPRRRFTAEGHGAVLLGDIQAAGMIQYAYLFLVYAQSSEEPVLIISSEFFAGGPKIVLGVFDNRGHQTLYNEGSDWTDEEAFATKAVALTRERLKITLTEHKTLRPWWRFW